MWGPTSPPPTLALQQPLGAARVQQAGPPLRGVVHSAGVLADGLLAKQSPQSLRAVWDAKVTGAVHLQRWAGSYPRPPMCRNCSAPFFLFTGLGFFFFTAV